VACSILFIYLFFSDGSSLHGWERNQKEHKEKREKRKVTSVAVGSSSVYNGCEFSFGSLVQIHEERACFNKNSVYLVVGYVFVSFCALGDVSRFY
jgi:hypothetical protein